MKKAIFMIILIILLSLSPIVPAEDSAEIKIVEVYYHTGPCDEYMILENWGQTKDLSDMVLTDLEGDLFLPNVTLKDGESLIIARDKEAFEEIWRVPPDYNYYELEHSGNFRLAMGGDEVILKEGEKIVDSLYYGDSQPKDEWEGDAVDSVTYGTYLKRKDMDTDTKEDWNWTRDWKVGHSEFGPKKISYQGSIDIFSSPDSSYESMKGFLDQVEEELKMSLYKFSNDRIARRIVNLSEEGVDIRVLLDRSPVGGLSAREKYSVNLLKNSDIEVHFIGGQAYSPYNFVHCKYMIADDSSVFITSENLGYTGFSPDQNYGNRGWGTIIHNEEIAKYYSDVFESDWYFSYQTYIEEGSLEEEEDTGYYLPKFNKTTIEGSFEVTPVISPDTAFSTDTIFNMIESAEESIYVQQFYIQNWTYERNPFVQELIRAAERGIDVKVQLDSTWYNVLEYEWDNEDVARELNEFAQELNIPLEARLMSDAHGVSKVHNKGMIVDKEKVLISSINWNSNSLLQNREVGVIIENKEVGCYFSEIFELDWKKDIVNPIADAGRDRNYEVGELVAFDGTYSWDDNNITTYLWDLDGNGDFEKDGPIQEHVYEEEGTYQIRLKVVDEEGNSDVDTAVIMILPEQNDKPLENVRETPPYLWIISSLAIAALLVVVYVKFVR
ncbi:MAG: phospholipase D-like domain-containing protein [Thermoplasmatota archaeon]